MTPDTVQVLYSRLSLLIPLPDDESSLEVPLSGTIGGGTNISPTLGARGPGTCDYTLRTLRGLVKFTCILITDNI